MHAYKPYGRLFIIGPKRYAETKLKLSQVASIYHIDGALYDISDRPTSAQTDY